jgi:glycosyltransferase involved in cell wall biosynthesis
MVHDINVYFKTLGLKVAVIVPESTVNVYDDIPIYQFHQRFEIEAVMRVAQCVCTQSKVIETAAQTSVRARKPLVLFSYDDTLEQWIKIAKKINPATYLVNTSEWLERVYRPQMVPSIVVIPPVFWKQYMTHTTREYITLINLTESNGASMFYRLSKRFPEYKFLGVKGSDKYINPPRLSNLTVVDNYSEIRAVYAQTGIICILSASEFSGVRIALEAGSSGIPVCAHPTKGLNEILGEACLYADREDEDSWANIIMRLQRNAFIYERASREISSKVKSMHPAQEIDRLKGFLDETRFVHASPDKDI